MNDRSQTVASPRVEPREVFDVLGRHMLVDGFHLVVDLEKSRGSRIYDSRTGKWFLDFYTFFASCPVGINHPKMKDRAFTEKLLRSAMNKPSNSDAYTVEMAEFVATLSSHALPPSLHYLFFVEGGGPGIENALKTAFDWKVRKNFAAGAKQERGTKIIHFRNAFHGRTGYVLSLTNTDPVKTDYFPKFAWPRIDHPGIRFPLEGKNLDDVKAAEARAVAQIEEAFRANPDDVAALIIEPIQGEGGDNHVRGEFLRELRRLCTENDALFIVDEVQTGVGLTGKMWCYQHFGFEPDILCFGKKLQMGGIMVSKKIDEVPDNVFRKSGRINSTWGSNLSDMVRAARYLEIIAEENMIANAEKMGDLLLEGLKKLETGFAGKVSNARGRGLMCAFDLETPELRAKTMERCHENNMLMLGSGPRGIRFRPALNITREEIEEGLGLLKKSLTEAIGS